MSTWKYIDSGPNTAAYNMALDEELLARAQAGETMPVLRLYTWDPPAVSIGRFQDRAKAVNEEVCRELGFDIVRRTTGGRAVLHRKELTYSVISRSDVPRFPPGVLGTYRVIALGLAAGLQNLGLAAEIISRGHRQASLVQAKAKTPACFSSPSWYEIVVNDRKIVGSAQRRLSGAFLQHGSILIDHDPLLEAQVIRGRSAAGAATCMLRELGREPGEGEIKEALLAGFARSLGIEFLR